jgi:hypothetical protein
MLAALGVAVLVIAVIALRHPGNRSATAGSITRKSTAPAPKSSPATTPVRTTAPPARTTAPPAPARLPLVVLNNTSTLSLAQLAASRFEAGGWTVSSTGNLSNDIISTCAYYDPSISGAQAAATALRTQFPAIKRIQPKFAELPAGPIVVVLTSDYAAG